MRIAGSSSSSNSHVTSKYETAGMKRSLAAPSPLGSWLDAPLQQPPKTARGDRHKSDDDSSAASDSNANHPSAQHPRATGLHRCLEPECGRAFNRKYTLVEHMKTHTGEKPHVCPVRTCGKRFSTSGNLSRHKRLHGFIQPLECPVEGCKCTFPSDNKLEKHMKFHLGSPVHVCQAGSSCGKTFSTMGNLNRHMKNHHPDLVGIANEDDDDANKPARARQLQQRSPGPSRVSVKRERGEALATKRSIPTMPRALHLDHLDAMASILHEEIDVKREEAAAADIDSSPERRRKSRRTILDDMINFHVNHFGGC